MTIMENRSVIWSAFALLVGTYLFFAIFIYAGRWQGDEFHTGAMLAKQGGDWMTFRILWSPRPFSEAILGLYLWLVNQTGERFIAPFLAALWALLLMAPFLGGRTKLPAVLLAMGLLIMAIAGRFNSEVLYWVQGAVAYIPTIAFSLFLTARFISAPETGRSPNGLDATALVFLASSSETGAFVVLPFSAMVLALSAHSERRLNYPALIALLSAVLVIYMTMTGRFQRAEEVSQSFTAAGELWSSFADATFYFLRSVVFFGENVARSHQLWAGLPAKVAFLVGAIAVGATLRPSNNQMKVISAWALSLLFAAFLTTFASYYKLGMPGAPRHITIQSYFLWIAIAMCGVVASQWLRARAPSFPVGVILLLISVSVPTGLSAKGAVEDLIKLDELVTLRDEVWEAGRATGGELVIHTCAPGKIVGYICPYPPAGEYLLDDGKNWVADAILRYFGKSKLVMKHQNG